MPTLRDFLQTEVDMFAIVSHGRCGVRKADYWILICTWIPLTTLDHTWVFRCVAVFHFGFCIIYFTRAFRNMWVIVVLRFHVAVLVEYISQVNVRTRAYDGMIPGPTLRVQVS